MNLLQSFASFEPHDVWIIATAAMCTLACAPLGSLLVLKRMALLSDAIAHAILPGLGVAFLLSGSRSPFAMVVGALVAGLGTSFLSSLISRVGRIPADAALGVVFTSFFAIGVIIVTAVAHDVDLDPGCVLYGALEFIPFDTVELLGFDVPRAFITLAVLAFANCMFAFLFFKELKLLAFDPENARTFGAGMTVLNYTFLTLVTITTVLSFEAAGSILVVSILIAPAAAALLCSRSLRAMMVFAAVFGVLACPISYAAALTFNTSAAGSLSTVVGAIFVGACLFAPQKGYAHRILQGFRNRIQVAREDILGFLFRWYELSESKATRQDVFDALGATFVTRRAIHTLYREGLVEGTRETVTLTGSGRTKAQALVRSHRLWEAFLLKKLNLPLDHLHEPASRTEHYISAGISQSIEEEVQSSADPHGKTIPKRS